MLRAALRYPLAGDRADEALVGGWALLLVAGVVRGVSPVPAAYLLVLLPLAGYLLGVLAASAAGESNLPAVGGPAALLADGFRGYAVGAAYLAVPVGLLAGTAGGLVRVDTPQGPAALLLTLGGTMVLLTAVVFAYLLPAALTAAAATGRVRPAFSPGVVRRAFGDGAYFYRFWVGAVVGAAGLAAASALWAAGGLLRVVSPPPAVYVAVVACRLWGVGAGPLVAAALGADLSTPSAAGPATGEPTVEEGDR